MKEPYLRPLPFSSQHRQTLIFGASGQIGSALLRALEKPKNPKLYQKVQSLSWSEILEKKLLQSERLLKDEILSKISQEEPCDIIFANGITDPRAPKEEIERSNLTFPIRVMNVIRNPSFRFLTFGTIQENFKEACETNPYLGFKKSLGTAIQNHTEKNTLHLQLHTAYRSPFKPHMFLGLLENALKENRPFEMSSGNQLREYHHVDDIARCVLSILSYQWDNSFLEATGNQKVIKISSGKAVRLAELARQVFRAFHREDLLKLGSLSSPKGENTEIHFKRSPQWVLAADRDPIEGVIQEFTKTLGTPHSLQPDRSPLSAET